MVIKKLSIALLIILAVSFMFNICVSNATYNDKMKKLVEPTGIPEQTTSASEKVTTVISVIITIIRIVGVTIAIVMLLAIAMKYMTAAAGEKAEIKKSAVQYVVGAAVLFGAVGILGIVNDFAKNISFSGN